VCNVSQTGDQPRPTKREQINLIGWLVMIIQLNPYCGTIILLLSHDFKNTTFLPCSNRDALATYASSLVPNAKEIVT